MTPVFCCSTACGVKGSAGMHFHNGGGTAISFVSTTVNGVDEYSMRSNPAAQRSYNNIEKNISTTVRHIVARFYIWFTSLPSNNAIIFDVERVVGNCEGVVFQLSDNTLRPGYNTNNGAITFGSTGFVVTTGIRYRVEVAIDDSVNPRTIDVQVAVGDGPATVLTQLTRAVAAQDVSFLAIGANTNSSPNTVNADVHISSLLVSQTAADYPLGPGIGLASSPNADGTHNITTGVYKDEAGNLITNATSTAWQHVNPVPLGSATFIDQTVISATDYFEVIMAAVGPQEPQAVDSIIAIGGSGAGAATAWKMLDGSTESAIFTGNPGAGTPVYKRKQFATPPSGGSWTSALWRALRFRAMYANGVTGLPKTYAVMYEADFPLIGVEPHIMVVRQAVKRAGFF